MNKIVLYIVIFLSLNRLNAEENTFEYLIQDFKELTTGNSILIKPENESGAVIYNLEYIFTSGDESIKIIREDSSLKSIGIVLKNTNALSYTNFGKNLIILTKENNNYYTSVISITGDILLKKLIFSINIPIENDKCQIINIIDQNSYLLKIDDNLFSLKFENENESKFSFISKIEGSLLDLDNKSGFNKPEYAILEDSNNGIIINFYDHTNHFLFLSKLVNYQKSKWIDLGTYIALLSSPVGMQTFIQIIDKNSGYLMSNFWIDADIKLINLENSGSYISATYISENGNGYTLNKMNILEDNKKIYTDKIVLGEINSEPLYLTEINKKVIIIFSNSIAVYDNTLKLIASKFYSKGKKLFDEYSSQSINTEQIGNTIYLISNVLSIKFDLVANEYWIFKKIYFEFKNYFLIIALVLILILFIQLYRHQRRLTKELLDLPTTGLLFVVDSVGRLTKINNSGREFLEITESAPKRKFFRFYARSPKSQLIAELIEKSLETKDNYNEKVTIRIENSDTEWLCKSIALRNVTGMFRGVVLSAVDITEQLERKRLSNWAQLAHDMQTNLSTIKLNAEHLDIELSENNQNRQKKILFQVLTLMQRVRDIVTVGRNDKLNLDACNAYELCLAVRNEFDELMFPNIEFEIESDNYSLLCDRPKLLRAVRNAVENGIKAMKGNPGKIKIKSWHERNYNVISVEDNGGGMDDEIKKKMLTPYFTTASKTGGSGIGTMIMQHVTEQHNGHIIVNSEKGIGTKVIFYIPVSVSNKGEKK